MQLGSLGTRVRHTLPHGRHAGYAGIVDLPAILGIHKCGVVDCYNPCFGSTSSFLRVKKQEKR